MEKFFASSEQMDLLRQLKEFESAVTHPKQFVGNESLVGRARFLLSEAHDLKMPVVSYSNLRLILSLYDTEMDMPEHLRWLKSSV